VDFATQRTKAQEKLIFANEVKALLQYTLDEGYKSECASMVLVFFCGVRVDEVNRLNWDWIRLDGVKSFVDTKEAKNRHRRVNTIPPNAVEWLKLCQSEGKVAPPNYTKRMQRLRKHANINYPQNAARHCFASYHIAYHRDAAQTAFLLGHPNAALLYNTYRELVTFEEAEKFWVRRN
jgi:integrase